MLDFTQAVTSATYIDQIIQILKERTLMNQMVFDIFDTNNDDKISQLDVYKLVRVFNCGPCDHKFENVLYPDIVQVS
jgi:hypothetical protein